MVFVELSALAVARHIGIFQSEALFTAIQGQIWFNMNIAEEGICSVSFFLSTFITVYEISDEAVLIVQTKHFKYTYF